MKIQSAFVSLGRDKTLPDQRELFLHFRQNENKAQVIKRYLVQLGPGFSLLIGCFLLVRGIQVIMTLLLPGSFAFSNKTYRSLDRLLSLVNKFDVIKNNNNSNNKNKTSVTVFKILQITQLAKCFLGINFVVHNIRLLSQFCHSPPTKFCVIRQSSTVS